MLQMIANLGQAEKDYGIGFRLNICPKEQGPSVSGAPEES
jgi:hypothetical protein